MRKTFLTLFMAASTLGVPIATLAAEPYCEWEANGCRYVILDPRPSGDGHALINCDQPGDPFNQGWVYYGSGDVGDCPME